MGDLKRLTARYQELHLPIPPKNAPLVFTGTRSVGKKENEITSVGYKISEYQTMCGTIICDNDAEEEIEATVANLPKMMIYGGFHPPIGEDSGLALAIIEKIRGNDDFALAVLKRAAKEPYQWFWSQMKIFAKQDADLDTRLSYLALQHWVNSVLVPSTEFSTILNELKSLTHRHPEMLNADVKKILNGLQMTVDHAYLGTTPAERMVDRLLDSRADGTRLESSDPRKERDYDHLIAISRLGFKIIPTLIEHMDDRRYTRALHVGIMNDPNNLTTVGEICSNLMSEYIPSNMQYRARPTRAQAEAWWSEAKNESERDACRKCLETNEEFPREVAIRWAEKQFPDLLVEVYNKIVKESSKRQVYGLLDAMVRSNINRKAIIETAKLGTKSKNPDHVHAANWILEEIDKGSFDASLIKTLEGLPKHASGPAWLSREASFAQQAAKSESLAVWKALQDATVRADVDLRLQLIQSSSYANHSPASEKLFLKYLLAFFDDTSVALPPQRDKDGMLQDQHFGLKYLRVQDLATATASYSVNASQPPKADAPRNEWAEYREQVRLKIKAFLDK